MRLISWQNIGGLYYPLVVLMMSSNAFCPCFSGKFYRDCCEPYHLGTSPPSALCLMRSRYAAYAYHLPDYIIATTHPHNPSYSLQRQEWKRSIEHFCKVTHFEGLTIHAFIDGEKESYVDFTAHLKQQGVDTTFREKSYFVKEEGRWLYKNGEHFQHDE